MDKGKVLYNNVVEAATIQASTEKSGFEVSYLMNSNPWLTWRSTGITCQVSIELPTATELKGTVLLNTNLAAGDTAKIQASDTPTFSTVRAEADIIDGYAILENWQPYQFYRLQFAKNAGDYIEIGGLYLATSYYQCETNFQWNWSQMTETIERRKKSQFHTYRNIVNQRTGYRFEFEGIANAQKNEFELISYNNYVCFLRESTATMQYGYFEFSDFTALFTDHWNVSATFWGV